MINLDALTGMLRVVIVMLLVAIGTIVVLISIDTCECPEETLEDARHR